MDSITDTINGEQTTHLTPAQLLGPSTGNLVGKQVCTINFNRYFVLTTTLFYESINAVIFILLFSQSLWTREFNIIMATPEY